MLQNLVEKFKRTKLKESNGHLLKEQVSGQGTAVVINIYDMVCL